MDERPSAEDELGAIEGADAAALGLTPPPESAPEAATIEDAESRVPGANFGDRVATDDKPWFTSLAYESRQSGVANDPQDAQEPEFPTSDDDPR